jgi:hypothetical protein
MIGFNKSSASVTNSSVTFASGTRDLPRQSQTATNQPNGGTQTQQIRGSSGLRRDSRSIGFDATLLPFRGNISA